MAYRKREQIALMRPPQEFAQVLVLWQAKFSGKPSIAPCPPSKYTAM